MTIYDYRRIKWETNMDWSPEDKDRTIRSRDALPEDLQNYEVPMVIVGTDVVSLFPSLDVGQVAIQVAEAVRTSTITWSEIDYLEGARYLALNWTAEQCKNSPLRRVLPTRRKTGGTRPGVRGTGPRGRTRGDQEQWQFPQIKLEEWEKKEIIAQVLKTAIEAMFKKHFYKFDGKIFQQTAGGPIGLRGTCALAKLIMNLFDNKWNMRLEKLGITTHLRTRYVDDGRIFLQPT